jgi:hypothetical protein
MPLREMGRRGMKTASHVKGWRRLMNAVPIAETRPWSSPMMTRDCSSNRRLTHLMMTSADTWENKTATVQSCRGTRGKSNRVVVGE